MKTVVEVVKRVLFWIRLFWCE